MEMVELNDVVLKLSRFLKLAGLNLLDNDFKINRFTILTGFLSVYPHIATWYFDYVMWPNAEQIIKSFSIYGFVIQVNIRERLFTIS